MLDPLLARQPIYDRARNIMGFELLFRSSSSALQADIRDGDAATSQLIMHACQTIGLDKLVGSRKAFVNLTRPFLIGEYSIPNDERIVYEILEDIVADEALIDAVHKLAEQGHAIALDDFIYSDDLKPLLEVANYVKLDLKAIEIEELPALVEKLREYDLSIIGEKIETRSEYDACHDLGIEFFQGYYLAEPTIITALSQKETGLATETDPIKDAG